MSPHDLAPSVSADLVARFGAPLGVEEARAHWGRLTRAAQDGATTLITRERWEWAALIPVTEVPGPLTGLAVLPLSTARRKLGDLVRQATLPYEDGPLLLTRHRTPVAALIAARSLAGQEAREHRLVVEDLLRDGHTVVLSRLPVAAGSAYSAVVRDAGGADVAAGTGDSVDEALRRLQQAEG
ncbi:type II toxin-antitoxin system prevent-host-death family antitoxin [Nonomuraea sp. SMC257]|uniref:Type II toxin-antitoxin system prevent-host-death family antitoxin n=1 Tax=Nonomuraea montanisoli TaxID=2741721 RepID=A0A7Y6M758_9ACTN|nr:type II toxin-antitoxin system prevent-host-death family antitoxin [Nonomuraea montanisoli]NUW36350.1 type II toxin-antitoxin system prevent-host-death family antitoxin [Nonomuraea montanisoli]